MAAPRAAGMPVWWPRRPAAASAAVAAGAGPDFSCAGELEQPLKALIGEVRSLSVVCVCVSGSVGRAGVPEADALAVRYRRAPWLATTLEPRLPVVGLPVLLDKAIDERVAVRGVITSVEVRIAARTSQPRTMSHG